ncbi:hypothetical protein [Pseudomonas massiliensis]|uniref:hypothetical protein n=1 Tax=Pseudomonas massiliensis TaxID=522492 RepID=UPI0011DD7A00|nr:hypothetical protein [Pseudomonas massiliensis]
MLKKTSKALKVFNEKAEHLRERLLMPFYLTRAHFLYSCPYLRLGTSGHLRARVADSGEKMALRYHDRRMILALALRQLSGYRHAVAASSATGRENPWRNWRNSAPIPFAGAFFTPADSCYGGRAWAGFGLAGFQFPRFLTPRTAATQSREKDGDSSKLKLESTMTTLNPSKIRAAAHRAMALAALRANSSGSVRLRRYNHHIAIARTLENAGGAQ